VKETGNLPHLFFSILINLKQNLDSASHLKNYCES
jgi:hypothetical protein